MDYRATTILAVKKDGKTVGVIGVIGPRRMNYKQVLKTLGDISINISSIIGEDANCLTDGNSNKGNDKDNK